MIESCMHIYTGTILSFEIHSPSVDLGKIQMYEQKIYHGRLYV